MVEEKRAIVFVNTKRQADNVYAKLDSLGYRWAPWLGCVPHCFNWAGAQQHCAHPAEVVLSASAVQPYGHEVV
jgi:hypothetical protein